MIKKPPLLVIVGPTASGKTSVSIELCKNNSGEVVSGDSMQIYKEMDIATAKPSAEEMQGIPHHLIDFLPPTETFSLSDYLALAKKTIAEIHERGVLPVLAGGTGLYISSLIDNISLSEVKTDENLRRTLENEYNIYGGEFLLEKLRKIDSESAKKLHPMNGKRIIRALEIYELTGINMTEHQRRSRTGESPYELYIAGLNFRDRQKLYERINRRTDKMLREGLVEEARHIFEIGASKTALQAIGYKELKPHLDSEITLSEATEKIKMETRRYAKRQLTWFRKDRRIEWFYLDEEKSLNEILKKIQKSMENKFNL